MILLFIVLQGCAKAECQIIANCRESGVMNRSLQTCLRLEANPFHRASTTLARANGLKKNYAGEHVA
jgi:hypothetical protein